MAVYILLLVITILFLILLLGGYYFFAFAIKKGNKSFILNQPHNKGVHKKNEEQTKIEKEWFLANKKDVYLKSSDGLNLYGAKVSKGKRKKWMILVHGFSATHISVLHQAYKFYELGFNILLIDLRAHGNSEGKYIGMGVLDSNDLVSWIKKLDKIEKPTTIGLYGISMGAATVMMSLGEKLPDSVSFAIEDCGYSSVFEVFKYQMKMMFNLPSFPFLNIAESWCKTIAKYDFHTKTSLTALAKTKIPVLFIHGTKDTFVPYQMLEENYDVCAAKKEKLIIHGAKHGASETKEPELYWKIIDKFTKKYEKKKN